MIFCLKGAAGEIIHLVKGEYSLGRDESNDIPVRAEEISRRHARLSVGTFGVSIEDLNSTNGSFLNGERVAGSAIAGQGDVLRFGSSFALECVELPVPDRDDLLFLAQPNTGHWLLPPGEYDLGRDPGCDICLPDESVSFRHLRMTFDGRSVHLEDLGSTNGTWLDGNRTLRSVAPLPQVLDIGSCRLFMAPSDTRLDISQSQQNHVEALPPDLKSARPDTAKAGFAVVAVIAFMLLIAGILAHDQWLPDRSGSAWSASSHTSAAEQQRQAQIQRAHQVVASVASDPAMRQRLRALAKQTQQVERSLRPLLNEVDRYSAGLQTVTGNPALRRMLSGTDIGSMVNQADRLLYAGRGMMNDLQRMPADLRALESALASYQSQPSRARLVALIEPANRAASQADRIHRGAATLEQALSQAGNQLNRLAATSRSWPAAPEISKGAAQASAAAHDVQRTVSSYRQTLASDLERIRRIRSEARLVERSQR